MIGTISSIDNGFSCSSIASRVAGLGDAVLEIDLEDGLEEPLELAVR